LNIPANIRPADGTATALARKNVASLHAAEIVKADDCLEQAVGFLHDGAALLFFFADVQQADARVGPLEHVAGVHGPELREVDELARVAIDVRTAVDDQD
jgi:hypothetical protein